MNLKDKISKESLPRHIAIIMDGNGRWARKQGLARTAGHETGVRAVRETVETAAELGISYLTLYAFSTENWNRPKYEIDALMKLLVQSIHEEMPRLMENNIRLLAIGDLGSLPAKSQAELKRAISATESNTGLNLVLALSYSARWELLEASRKIARLAAQGALDPESLDIPSYSSFLVTAGIPDPELLIRTSGEYRISNFLLWQIAYAELYFTPTLWPDFRKDDLYRALIDYQSRERRFGLTSEQINEMEHKRRR